jgi:hypothetical protein
MKKFQQYFLKALVSNSPWNSMSTRRIACTCFFGGCAACARRCSTRRIACTCFFRGCARKCSTRHIACTRFLCGCARICPVHCTACTVSRFGCARTCWTPRNANIGFFVGCAGTLRAFSSQLHHLSYYCALLLQRSQKLSSEHGERDNPRKGRVTAQLR